MADAMLEDAPRAEVNGAALAYREVGRGEPVVLVHGSASDMRAWHHQLPALGAAYRTVAYSRRYALPNDPIPDGADDAMLPHVDDLVAFIEAVGAKPAHLVGHSWGGFIALLAAIRHPEAVRRLVLLEPPVLSLFVSTPPRPMELVRMLVRRPRTAAAIIKFGAAAADPATKAYRRGDDEAGFEIFARGVLGSDAFERLSPERLSQAWDNRAVNKAQLLGAGFPPLRDDEVRSMTAPTLLLVAEHSPAFLHRLTDHLEALLPNVQRTMVPDASHIMQEDNPQAVNDAVLGFLGDATAP